MRDGFGANPKLQVWASVAVCLASLGCEAHRVGGEGDVSKQEMEIQERKRRADRGGDGVAGPSLTSVAPPPSGTVLPPLDLDQEVVFSVGTRWVIDCPRRRDQNPGATVTEVIGIQGDQLTLRHTLYQTGGTWQQPDTKFTMPKPDDAALKASEIVQVRAGRFRCSKTHQSFGPPSNIDATSWTSVDLGIGVKDVFTQPEGPSANELIRIENATIRTRRQPEASPTAPGSRTLGVAVNEDAGEGRGISVASVTEDGPAERAGIEPGDLIQKIDGTPTLDLKGLHHAVASASRKATVTVLRRKKQLELTVSLPEKAAEPVAAAPETAPRGENAASQTGDTYVLAIGINEYDDARIPKLHFAEQDARSIYAFYATSRKSPTAQDRVLLLAGKDATRNRILRAIREHLERKATHPEDTVVLYFAGHGFSDADNTYLAGTDTQVDSLPETGLSSATLREYWGKIRACRKVLIMDACHCGGIDNMRGTRGVSGVKIGEASTEGGPTPASTTLVIAATGPNELSTEDANLGHGVFTNALLNGLGGEADDNKDGRVTGEELGKYLVREVPGIARGYGGNQTPVVTQTSGGPAILLTR